MASVTPVTTFLDEPTGWLDYVARVTRSTVGARWTASQLALVGTFDADSSSVEDVEVLKGTADAVVEFALPRPAGAGAAIVLPDDGERVLAFLTAGDSPGAWRPIARPGALEPESATDDFDADLA